MLSAKEIQAGIMVGSFSNTELNSFLDAIKYARGVLGNKMKQEVVVGDKVRWYSSKSGTSVEGILEKISKKNVVVNIGGGERWRVPANMIEKV